MTNKPNTNSHGIPAASDCETVFSSEELRKSFRAFVKDDVRFRKFIECCNVTARERGRFTFWQQQLWESFTDRNREFADLEFSVIVDAFHLCHIHMAPLRRAVIPIRKGVWCVTHSAELEEQISRDAPYSLPYALDSPAWSDATHINVDHCDECLERRKELGA